MRIADCGSRIGRGALAFSKSAIHNPQSDHTRTFTIPAPTADADVLFRILTTHLEGLRLEQRPTGVRLRIEPAPADHRQLRLFESPLRDANRFGETIARLAALVGNGNVGVVEVEDTHRPDRFRITEPQFHELREGDTPVDHRALGLPLRRYRPPLSAQVRVVHHAPTYVVSESAHGPIAAAMGPYRAGGGWWDQDAWADEEWDVQLATGALYRLCRRGEAWLVEGCYDRAPHPSHELVATISRDECEAADEDACSPRIVPFSRDEADALH